MKNKGFTLIELMAVIALLSIIALIAVPLVNDAIISNNESLYNNQIKSIKEGLKTWSYDNTEYLPKKDGETLILNLGYLKTTGFINVDVKNPNNHKCFANDMTLFIKKVGNNYDYLIDENSGSSETCKEPDDDYYVFYRGNSNVKIKKGEILNESYVYITDRNGNNINPTVTYLNSSNTSIDTINTNVIGTYKINYTFMYKTKTEENKEGNLQQNVEVTE